MSSLIPYKGITNSEIFRKCAVFDNQCAILQSISCNSYTMAVLRGSEITVPIPRVKPEGGGSYI